MATPTSKEQVCLKLLIDEKKNKVLFAQAGKDFVDVLLSFLTLPLGTIARLVSKEPNVKKVRVGSLTSLYESVANIDEKLFWTATCKEMLLQPRNSVVRYCQNMKLNIDNTEKTEYFICEDWGCSRKATGGLLSTFRNQRCKCDKPMNRQIYRRDSSANGRSTGKGFVQETPTFLISDDLSVKPDDFQISTCLLTNLGSADFDAIKLVTVNVTRMEILPIDEVPASNYSCYSKCNSKGKCSGFLTALKNYSIHQMPYRDEIYAPLSYLEPQSPTSEAYSGCGGRGFAKRPSLYMVTDDLSVSPSSSVSAISFLTELRIPPSDLEERIICIGKVEGLSLLKASLTSLSSLTNGLSPFLKPVKGNVPKVGPTYMDDEYLSVT